MYDINWFFSRFQFADLCDSFPKGYKIKLGFTPLDLLRYRYHGKLVVNMKNNEVNIYKQRNFQRFDQRFKLTVHQIEFLQHINYLEWVIKNVNISKVPMKEYETKLLRIPLIENILRFQYNKEGINNHYRHVGCATIEGYMENIKDYSTHNIAIEILLHIPSLRNKDALDEASNQDLLPYFIQKSYVPVFHFQKSYMSPIYDFICEYIFKKDYSVKENVTQYPINYDVRGKALVSDLIAIFSDFDYDKYSGDNYRHRHNLQGESQYLPKDNIQDLSQEELLSNYNGIIISLENFFIMNKMEIIHIKDYKTERMKFRIGDAESRCECFQISYLSPKYLLSIRDKNFESFRLKNYEDSFDNIRLFCEKFELDYEHSRKTLFPGRKMDAIYETDAITQRNIFNPQKDFYDYEDFVFSNTDTIAVVLLFKYKKNDEIKIQEFLNMTDELSIGCQNISGYDTYQDVKVTHNITILGLRLLYTLKIEYLFYHHFFENFNMEAYKKSDYYNLDSKMEYDPFSNYNRSSRKAKKKRKQSHKILDDIESVHKDAKSTSFEFSENTTRELFMVLDVEKPQFNFQNIERSEKDAEEETSNSQLLLVGKETMKVHFYNYVWRDPNNSRKKHSIKKQIKCEFKQMVAYVAPTNIDIVSPTFWLNNNDFEVNGEGAGTAPGMENLLRKIMNTQRCIFNFDIYNENLCNFNKPHVNIEIKIEDSKAKFSPENWWHLVFVLQSILFASGEVSEKKLLIDQLRQAELKEYKFEQLREMIQSKLQLMVTQYDVNNRPMIDKKIVWQITTGNLRLYDDNELFSTVDLSNFTGHFIVYNNKDTKCDIDIKKVLIQNHIDSEEYKWTLFPGYSELNPRTLDHMLKVRIRDKLVVVKQAPWKIFDQFEIFLDSMTVKLTKKFYLKIQQFMLFKEEQKKLGDLQSMKDEKKIDMLMPSRTSTFIDYAPDELEEQICYSLNTVNEESKSGIGLAQTAPQVYTSHMKYADDSDSS